MGVDTISSIPFPNPITNPFIADDTITNAKINSAANISPAKILMSGTTLLSAWQDSSDATKIKNAALKSPAISFIGSHAGGSVTDNTNENTVANLTIAAGTVTTGVIIIASIFGSNINGNDLDNCTFKLKTGTLSSEALRKTDVLGNFEVTADTLKGWNSNGAIIYYESSLTWADQQSIIITAQKNVASTNQLARCGHMVVLGF